MRSLISTPRGTRAIQLALIGLVLATAATVCAVVSQSGAAAQSLERGGAADRDRGAPVLPGSAAGPTSPRAEGAADPAASADALTEADGVLPADAGVFDEAYPGISRLRPELLRALQSAAAEARDHGVEFTVNSGWRSAAYQEQLLRDAVAAYGSREEAARWVASSDASVHVSGGAVDLEGDGVLSWLADRGAAYGLCQTYDNEPWHYEFVADAPVGGCPQPYADPTADPRLQP